MGAAGFWRFDAAAEMSDWAHQHQYEYRKWWAKSRIPGPGCPADGYKMVLCLCPAKAAHNCCPIRSLLAGGPRNSNYVHSNPEKKCPWRGPRNSNLCPQQSRKKIYPWRGPWNSNLCPQQSRKKRYPWRGPWNSNLCPQQSPNMSLSRSEERQFMSAAIPNNVHGEGPRNSNICPQQSRKMSIARSEEQQLYNNPENNCPWYISRWRAKKAPNCDI